MTSPPQAQPDARPPGADPDGPMLRLRRALAAAWAAVCDVGHVLQPCRFSVFVIAGGGALLFLSDQGRELAVRLPDEPTFWRGLAFHVAVFIWAFESWYWSRLMVGFMVSRDRQHDLSGQALSPRLRFLVNHLPRIIAASAYLIAAAALSVVQAWRPLAVSVIVGAAFYWGLVKRLSVTERLRGAVPEALQEHARGWLGDASAQPSTISELPHMSRTVLYLSLVLAGTCIALVAADAGRFGGTLGAAAVPFLALGLIVPVGSLLVYWSCVGRSRGYPAVTVLILWALAVEVGCGRIADNHVVRVARDRHAAARTDLADAVARWHARATAASGSDSPPLVIVATAGGGLRAAYWTATVLGGLQDADARFGQYLFAISGVSGGSLGATVFTTLLADARAVGSPAEPSGTCAQPRGPFECAGQAVLSQDFLAPVVAALFFTDLAEKFVPLFPNGHDRAAALETSWERAWGRAGIAQTTWVDRSFTSLWAGDRADTPALLLNSTHVETGKRAIASNLRTAQGDFADAYDVIDIVAADMPISTAAHNSARFTYVSPAGTLRAGGSGDRHGHLVDGGYFENYGAATAQDLLHAVMRELARTGRTAQPVLIQISSEPGLTQADLALDAASGIGPPAAGTYWGSEVLSPLRALLNARSGRGTLAYKEFLREVPDDRRAHFRLCPTDGQRDPALGWVLSRASEELMATLLRSDACGNRSTLARVLAALRQPAERPP